MYLLFIPPKKHSASIAMAKLAAPVTVPLSLLSKQTKSDQRRAIKKVTDFNQNKKGNAQNAPIRL